MEGLASTRSTSQVPCSPTYCSNVAAPGSYLSLCARKIKAPDGNISNGHHLSTPSLGGESFPATSSSQSAGTENSEAHRLRISGNKSPTPNQDLDDADRQQTIITWLSNPEAYNCCIGKRGEEKDSGIEDLFTRWRAVGPGGNEKGSGTMAPRIAHRQAGEDGNLDDGKAFQLAGIGTWVDG